MSKTWNENRDDVEPDPDLVADEVSTLAAGRDLIRALRETLARDLDDVETFLGEAGLTTALSHLEEAAAALTGSIAELEPFLPLLDSDASENLRDHLSRQGLKLGKVT